MTEGIDPAIRQYYDRGREAGRLETTSRIEFLRTQELLQRFLPPPPSQILDVGGGAGAHALPLIAVGHDVTVIDPVELHITQARAAGVATARLGDARHLDASDSAYDAVLVLGPLYHLTDRTDRVHALREAARVVRPGGIVAVAVISRFASTYDGLLAGFLTDDRFENIVENDLATGQHRNPTGEQGWFTTAYFHHPDEVAAELADAGLDVVAVIAIEGPASALTDPDVWLSDPDRTQTLLRAIRRVEQEPSVLGASAHLLGIGRRPGIH